MQVPPYEVELSTVAVGDTFYVGNPPELYERGAEAAGQVEVTRLSDGHPTQFPSAQLVHKHTTKVVDV